MKKLSLSILLLCTAIGMQAQKAMKAPAGGKAISNELIGIFFEDISSSADGGLNAELLQNGSFEFNANERDGWGPSTAWRIVRPGHSLGMVGTKQQDPIHPNNPNYMRITAERTRHFHDFNGWSGYGLENRGFNGISVKAGEKYDFSMFYRKPFGEKVMVRLALIQPGSRNNKETVILDEDTIVLGNSTWAQTTVTLTPNADCEKAAMQVLLISNGTLDVDMLSLVPQDTYKGHGLRKDMVEALEALHPKFMRFPGGCIVHGGGDGFWNTYRWKETVGPKETRKGQKNCWGYHQSFGLGYYEYFQLCEDLGMQPVPILPCGVSCQGANGGWNMWPQQAQDACPMEDMDMWTQEALDLIEWANGPVTSKWGRVRAEAGHPEPFGLKYLGVGNEEKITPEFEERFKYMYERITKAHPEIVIVGTAGPGSHKGNPDYENGWRLANETGMPIIDEHYYEKYDYFLNSRQYDNYPRDRKTKVYLGEYASKDKKLIDALAEALYLIHVERNADVVTMTSYAPLFARKDGTSWNPDLIYFDNERTYLTCSYYVQQMFGQSSGNMFYGDCVTIADRDKSKGEGMLQEQSVVLDTKSHTLYIKVANASANEKTAQLNLSQFPAFKSVTKTTLQGQPTDENNYEAQPIKPVVESCKLKKNQKVTIAPYSFTMYTIKL